MAKHNRWSKVKHRKAAVEKKRSKAWTKIIRAVMVAARAAGPDPSANTSLRFAMDEARYANIPRDTVERAIKKATGEGAGDNFETMRYEGYAPGGVAVIVDALTDNRTRTIADVRLAFSDAEGNVGATGSVAYMFAQRGEISLAPSAKVNGDRVMEIAIDAGAEDVEEPGDEESGWTVYTDPVAFENVKLKLEGAGLSVAEAAISMIPANRVEVRGEQAKGLMDLVDALEELDDVQKVYHNGVIPDDELAKME
ncbi:MAG: YebC/PmpR family DNA-binding transcriptional regulator [Planctomycetes bacterium]|nr:YebC/PmpR family DNA-binding transcriptional regulator [Planctomycetota bacterium]